MAEANSENGPDGCARAPATSSGGIGGVMSATKRNQRRDSGFHCVDNREELDNYLEQQGLHRYHISADGNSVFRAAAEALLDCQARHAQVRARCVAELRAHPHLFRDQLDSFKLWKPCALTDAAAATTAAEHPDDSNPVHNASCSPTDGDRFYEDGSSEVCGGVQLDEDKQHDPTADDNFLLAVNRHCDTMAVDGEPAGELEMHVLSHVFQADFLVYSEAGREPQNVTANGFREQVVLVVGGAQMPPQHVDLVYTNARIEALAEGQSMIYDLLYREVFGLGRVELDFAVNEMVFHKDRFHNQGSSRATFEQWCEAQALNGEVPQIKDLPPDENSRVLLAIRSGVPPFPFKVAKCLEKSVYRNVEYLAWCAEQRELQRRMSLHPVGFVDVGMRCLVNQPGGSSVGRVGTIQQVDAANGTAKVFVHFLRKVVTMDVACIKVLPHKGPLEAKISPQSSKRHSVISSVPAEATTSTPNNTQAGGVRLPLITPHNVGSHKLLPSPAGAHFWSSDSKSPKNAKSRGGLRPVAADWSRTSQPLSSTNGPLARRGKPVTYDDGVVRGGATAASMAATTVRPAASAAAAVVLDSTGVYGTTCCVQGLAQACEERAKLCAVVGTTLPPGCTTSTSVATPTTSSCCSSTGNGRSGPHINNHAVVVGGSTGPTYPTHLANGTTTLVSSHPASVSFAPVQPSASPASTSASASFYYLQPIYDAATYAALPLGAGAFVSSVPPGGAGPNSPSGVSYSLPGGGILAPPLYGTTGAVTPLPSGSWPPTPVTGVTTAASLVTSTYEVTSGIGTCHVPLVPGSMVQQGTPPSITYSTYGLAPQSVPLAPNLIQPSAAFSCQPGAAATAGSQTVLTPPSSSSSSSAASCCEPAADGIVIEQSAGGRGGALELACGIRFPQPSPDVDTELAYRCQRNGILPIQHPETLNYFFRLGMRAFKHTMLLPPSVASPPSPLMLAAAPPPAPLPPQPLMSAFAGSPFQATDFSVPPPPLTPAVAQPVAMHEAILQSTRPAAAATTNFVLRSPPQHGFARQLAQKRVKRP